MQTKKRQMKGQSGKSCLRPSLFPLYHACINNAQDLLDEAQMLLDNGHHARAYVLAFTAYEEIGKSQIVADYITDVVCEEEFVGAFRDHSLKAAYVSRFAVIANRPGPHATIEYDKNCVKDLIETRSRSLYVGIGEQMPPIEPQKSIDANLAREIIDTAREALAEIEHAEWLNQRIGTKGLFK